MTSARNSVVVFFVAQYVAVAALAATVATMLGRFPFGSSHTNAVVTGPATRVATTVLDAATLVLVLAPVCAVVVVAAFGSRVAERANVGIATLGAGLGVPSLAVLGVASFLFGFRVGQLVVVVLLVAGLPLVALLVARVLGLLGAGEDDGDRATPTGLGPTATLAVCGVVCLGVVVGLAGTTVGAETLVEHDRFATPQVAFEFSEEAVDGNRRSLTVRHAGGDAVQADRLFVTGDGVTEVAGADQAAGTWAGGTVQRGDRRLVGVGNETTVGVSRDCDVRVVYRPSDERRFATTLAMYECGEDE